ncbi:MAG: hypothetical protein FJX72_00430 [Armatimonadetes bacterium]|nr:hypothetical protein [Armatimonadota bacterium]
MAGCAACRRQLEADARLCDALSELGSAPIVRPTWAQVKAAHAAQRPSRRFLWMAPAFGSAAVAAAVLWIALIGGGRIQTPPVVATDTSDTTAREAHLMLAASDLSGDPNRAIVAWYGGRESR